MLILQSLLNSNPCGGHSNHQGSLPCLYHGNWEGDVSFGSDLSMKCAGFQ